MALKVGELFASFGIDTKGLDGALKSIETKVGDVGRKISGIGKGMTLGVTLPMAAIAKSVVNAGMSFTSQMKRVEAISGATAEQMEILNKKAIDMGSTTVFTATESGKALEYMAMAGWKTEEMLAGIGPVMSLAAASGEELGTVSDIVTDSLTAFGLKAQDATRFADVLAAAATNSNTNVGMMGETFKYAAPVAGALGYTIEDTALAIGLMANAGIKGSMAGTALRGTFTRLAKPTKDTKMAMKDLNISITDANGKMKPLKTLLGEMRGSFSKLTQEQKAQYAAMIAGQHGMSGLLAIMNATEDEFNNLADAINNSTGAAENMAATALDDLKGDLTILRSALEGTSVEMFKLSEGGLRSLTQEATKAVEKFRGMDDTTKIATMRFAGLAAATGPALIAIGGLVSTAGKLVPILSALASPMAIVGAGLAVFALAAVDANNDIGKMFVSMSKTAKTELTKFNSTLTTRMQTISRRMPAVIGSITTSIKNVVPALMDTLTTGITGFMDVISDNAFDLAGIGISLIESIVGGISKSLPNLVPAAARVVTNLASALISNLPKLVDTAIEFGKALWDGLKKINWAELGTQLWDSLVSAFNSVSKSLGNLFADIDKGLKEVDWAKTGEDIWNWIKGAFGDAKTWLRTTLMGDADTPLNWTTIGNNIWNWIKGAFVDTANWLVEVITGDASNSITWETLGGDIWGWIKGAFEGAGEWFKNLIVGEKGTWEEVWPTIWEWISGAGKTVADWLKGLLVGEEGNWSDAWNKIWTWISNAATSVADWLKKLLVGESGNWSDVWSKVWGWISGAATTVADWFKKLIVGEKGNWSDVWGTIWGWIKSGATVAGDWLKNLIVGKDGTWSDAGKQVGGLFQRAFQTATSQISVWLGLTKLNYKDLKRITDNYTVPKSLEMAELVTAQQNVTNLASEIGTLQEQINKETMKVKLGIELEGSDATTFAGHVDGLINSGIALIQAQEYEVNLTLKTLFGEGNETASSMMGSLFGPYFALIEKEAGAAGSKARSAMVAAMADGKISPEEAAKIELFTQEYTATVERALAKNSLDAKMLRLRTEGTKDGLINWRDIRNLVNDIMRETQNAINTLSESESTVIDIAYKAAAALDFDVDKTRAYIDSIRAETQNMVDAANIEAINWSFDTLLDQTIPVDIAKFFEEGKLSFDMGAEKWRQAIMHFAPDLRHRTREMLNALKPSTEQLSAVAESYEAAGLEIPKAISDALRRVDALGAIGEDIHTLFTFLHDEFGYSISDLKGMTTEEMAAVMASVAEILRNDVEIPDAISTLWESIFSSSLSAVDSWRPELEANLRALGVDAGSLLGIALPEGVAKGLADGTMSVEQAAAKIAAAAAMSKSQTKKAVDDNVKSAEQSAAGVVTGMENKEGDVTTASGDLATETVTATEVMVDGFTETATEATESMATTIDQGAGEVVQAVATMSADAAKEAIETLSSDAGKEIGTSFLSGVLGGINELAESVKTAVATVASESKSKASSILAFSAARVIGLNFSNGIAEGIRAGIQNIKNAAQQAAKAAPETAKQELTINSPSVVARKEVGQMYSKGMALGILDNLNLVMAAARKVSGDMHNSMNLGDPSHGTVYTSRNTIQQTARQTADATDTAHNAVERAHIIGKALADRLIESGALNAPIYIDNDKVGEKVQKPVNDNTDRETRSTIDWRIARGVQGV